MGKYIRFFHFYPPKMKIVVTVFALHLQKKNGNYVCLPSNQGCACTKLGPI